MPWFMTEDLDHSEAATQWWTSRKSRQTAEDSVSTNAAQCD